MSATAGPAPRLVHSLPGRVRVHVPSWSGASTRALERRVCRLRGVRRARANVRTRNLLVHFDRETTDEQTILARLGRLGPQATREEEGRSVEDRPARRPVMETPAAGSRRARIAVRGLERDPDLGGRVVERLEAHPGVRRASASPLTGRVLIEVVDPEVDLDELVANIEELEPPELGDEEIPSHPLDPAPVIQSTARLIGSALGLGLIAVSRVSRPEGPPVAAGGAAVAGAVGIVEGMPPVEERVEDALGRDETQLLLGALTIASLTFSGGALGLAAAGAGALGLMTEARARRAAWREYEERVGEDVPLHAGVELRLDAGARLPLPAEVIDGFGRAVGPDGGTLGVAPGGRLPAGARVYGQAVAVKLARSPSTAAAGRRHPVAPSLYDRYLRGIVPVSLAYGALLGLLRGSLRWAFGGLLLANPRAALLGAQQADNRASARVLRCGVTVAGTRRGRVIRGTDAVLLSCPRVLTDGLEVSRAAALDGEPDPERILGIAAAVANAAGSPWGGAFGAGRLDAVDGTFDGNTASAEIAGERWTLEFSLEGPAVADEIRRAGEEVLLLGRQGDSAPLGVVAVRPRLARGIERLRTTCGRRDVELGVVAEHGSPTAEAVARRAGVALFDGDLAAYVSEHQRDGGRVTVVTDNPPANNAFGLADLAIALTSGRRGRFLARADLLAPTLAAVAEVVEAGGQRDRAVNDSVGLSLAGNLAGGFLGLRAAPGAARLSDPTYIAALGAMGSSWLRLHGGRPPRSVAERLADPLPERWGRLTPDEILRVMGSRPAGLTDAEAHARRRPPPSSADGHGFRAAVLDQVRSPLIGALVLGAGLSFALGAFADVAMIGAVIVANAGVGAWQERQTGRAAEALQRMSVPSATVLRDGEEAVVPATEVVSGDVIVIAPGTRIAADARLLDADGLEIDEAALTGESLPVPKSTNGGADASRVVLEGSDVVVGTGRAVVVAIGGDTRMGALAAALALDSPAESPLDAKLRVILRQALPVIAIAGGLVVVPGVLRGSPFLLQLALGASAAIAAVPEALPVLAGVAEAAVARRLAGRGALARQLTAVESLGRVDVACADKTGTLTAGHLAVRVVAGPEGAGERPERLTPALADVLLTAAVASPHPDAAHARSHPTDVAVLDAAELAGLGQGLRTPRGVEVAFEPTRGFHAARIDRRVVAKGAPEVIAPRCDRIRREGGDLPIGEDGHRELQERAEALSAEGLRVLMVGEGPIECGLEDPQGLVALGFVGIADPLRPTVPSAVRRCREAGVRVVMLTGDHPATARAIASEAGLPVDGEALLTGVDVAELDDDELGERLERARVIARITPLDKVRIVEALQRRGHVVAMTGDGVNDAPALRLADVGVAMGETGTDVAREAADMVITDDDFSTLVEALVEGRGFWTNMRHSLGLLLGGNLGELGLIAGASVAGLPAPLTTRQILAVNLVTDVLPAAALAVQEPEHRDLSGLAREGPAALDAPLRAEILRRGVATAVPSLGAYLAARRITDPMRARSVAFASIVATQLGHTLDLGPIEGRLSGPVVGAVAASAGVTVASLAVPGLQGFLGLAVPGPLGGVIVVAATLGAVGLARALPRASVPPGALPAGA